MMNATDPKAFAAVCWVTAVLALFVAHVVLCRRVLRVRPHLSPQKATALLGLALNLPLMAGVLAGAVALRWPAGEWIWILIYLLLAYNGVACAYFHWFNLSETGRRIRLLLELSRGAPLRAAPDPVEVDPHSADNSYGAESMVRQRLERLHQMGQADQVDDRWQLRGRLLLRLGKLVHWAGWLAATSSRANR